jgi:hypothetical protein
MIRNWKRSSCFCLALVVALSAGAPVGYGQDARPSDKAAGKPFSFNPPARGAPVGRIGGSTRGTMATLGTPGTDIVVEVLAPDDHVGLSAVDQPVLYWFLSHPVDKPVEVTIDKVELSAAAPLVETTLMKSWRAGISALALRDLGVRLKPGSAYRWSVAVVIDPTRRSLDVTASGLIQYAGPASGPVSPAPESAARLYAEKGYWYDALAAVSRDVERRPDRRIQRADLLEQVGHAVPAAFDLAALRTVSAQYSRADNERNTP